MEITKWKSTGKSINKVSPDGTMTYEDQVVYHNGTACKSFISNMPLFDHIYQIGKKQLFIRKWRHRGGAIICYGYPCDYKKIVETYAKNFEVTNVELDENNKVRIEYIYEDGYAFKCGSIILE